MFYQKKPLILASSSPRRIELLTELGLRFTVSPPDIDENIGGQMPPAQRAAYIAKVKGDAIASTHTGCAIISADTMVVVEARVLGKPSNKDDAMSMLELLNNRTHSVYTGYCVIDKFTDTKKTNTVESRVTFKELTSKEIEQYTDTEEPYDKAGSYAAQGLGSALIARIDGSRTNVIGLPLEELTEDLILMDIVSKQVDDQSNSNL